MDAQIAGELGIPRTLAGLDGMAPHNAALHSWYDVDYDHAVMTSRHLRHRAGPQGSLQCRPTALSAQLSRARPTDRPTPALAGLLHTGDARATNGPCDQPAQGPVVSDLTGLLMGYGSSAPSLRVRDPTPAPLAHGATVTRFHATSGPRAQLSQIPP